MSSQGTSTMIRPLDTLIAHKVISLAGDLSSTDKRVAAMLVEHFNRKTGQCDPSMDTMAELIAVDRRTVVRSIRRLVTSGFFRKLRHGGKFHRNSYEPMWAAFHRLDDAWKDLRSARRAAFASPNLSLCQGQVSPAASGKDVTQTFPTNHFKETLRTRSSNAERLGSPQIKKSGSADFRGWSGIEPTLERLKKYVGEAVCRSWLSGVEFVSYSDGIMRLTVTTQYHRDNIINRLEPQLIACFQCDYPDFFRIELEVRDERANHDRRPA